MRAVKFVFFGKAKLGRGEGRRQKNLEQVIFRKEKD